MVRVKWTVAYRANSQSPQQELDRYTKESALHFADGIIEGGGVAIVVETEEEVPEHTADDSAIPQLNLDKGKILAW